jgi:peptidoglycan hydrolase-like protein with peptidoglycan-binding domain
MRAREFLREAPNPAATATAPVTPKPGAFSVDVPQGRRGVEVADLQKALIALGYQLPKHGVDGIRGPETSAAVKQFQQDTQLNTDGIPGPETIDKLNDVLASKPNITATLKKSLPAEVKAPAASSSNIDTTHIQDPTFNGKLKKIADDLGVKSSDLIAIMKLESGVNPKAVNSMSGATGLIQFMPKTAQSLGTTTQALYSMSAVDQLDYVYKYFKMVGVKPGMTLQDLYMAVFMPAAMGKGPDHVLGQKDAPGFAGKVYAQNAGLDKNRDGTITVADATQSVSKFA